MLDLETLKRQKEELLLKKQEKERHLAELIPDNVEHLKQQREVCNIITFLILIL